MFVVFAPVDKLLYTSAPCPAPAGLLVTRSSPRSFLSVVALHVACLPSQCFSSWWVAGSFISAKSCLPVFPPPMVTFPYAQQQAASLLFLLNSVLPRPSPSSCRSPLCWAPALSSPSPSSSLPSRFSSGKTSNLITPLSGYSILCLSEQLTASKKHRDCAYRTRFKCVSTDLQTQHTPGSPDMGKFPSYLHILSWTCKNLVLHGENGWNHMGNNLSLHTFISNFLLDLIRHLELFSLELTIKS